MDGASGVVRVIIETLKPHGVTEQVQVTRRMTGVLMRARVPPAGSTFPFDLVGPRLGTLVGIRVDLEADGQRRLRVHAPADAAVLLPCDGFVELQGITPEGFTAECVRPEDLPPLIDHPLCVLIDLLIGAWRVRGRVALGAESGVQELASHDRHYGHDWDDPTERVFRLHTSSREDPEAVALRTVNVRRSGPASAPAPRASPPLKPLGLSTGFGHNRRHNYRVLATEKVTAREPFLTLRLHILGALRSMAV
jgi:hypothetical protein